jgi:integrase
LPHRADSLAFYLAQRIFRLPSQSSDFWNFVAMAVPAKWASPTQLVIPDFGHMGAFDMHKRLSPRTIRALKPGKDGIRHGDVVMDDHTENFGVRVLGTPDRPSYSFVYVGRFPGAKNPTRVAIAPFVYNPEDEKVATDSLKRARAKAYKWGNSIEEGRDPRIEEARQRQAEVRKANSTFGGVAEDWFKEKLPSERRGKDVETDVRREFLPKWKALPIEDITPEEIARVIKLKARTAPTQARNLLGHARRLFQWAVDRLDDEGHKRYALKISPAAGLKPKALDLGEKKARDRLLSDDEVRAFWRGAARMSYPAGAAYKMLILTGCRLSEVSDARWSEFHHVVRTAIRQRGDKPVDWSQFNAEHLCWVVPASRMKGRPDTAKAHTVPLTVDMLRILESLPQFSGNDPFLFSRNFGRSPAIMSTELKDDLDARMLRTLRALARQRGEDHPDSVKLENWVNHDLRRVVRSGLSRLKVAEEVREAVLAHVKPGIKKHYDVYEYFDEKRDALMQWNARLRSIVEPTPVGSNVVTLRA